MPKARRLTCRGIGLWDRPSWTQLVALVALLVVVISGFATAQGDPALLLFGGDGHKTFLGCLNCGKFESGSICNKFGQHGSKFMPDSIWNKFGNFGSKFSNQSPWNRFALDPPVIVDNAGNFYGHLTANRFNPKRTQINLYVTLSDLWEAITDDPESIADRLCGRT
jgi:hypothetical protein